jgi:glutamyl-tRNA reductase
MLISLGLDFRHAGLSVRERFHRSVDDADALYRRREAAGLSGLLVLDTCNRVEAYATAGAGEEEARRRLAALCARGGSPEELLAAAEIRTGKPVVRHVLRVTCGLESQVLGDIHILGQVRRAYRRADEAGALDSSLHRLFEIALRSGKRVKTETALMAGHCSVGAAAARLAGRSVSDPSTARAVVVGCGKTGSHAARALRRLEPAELTLVNRTRRRAEELAAEVGGGTAPLEVLHETLARARLGVVATAADRPLVTAGALADARRRAGTTGAPLMLVDVSMPRNVAPDVGELEGVELVDLDALDPEAAAVEAARKDAVREAEALVEDGVGDFAAWAAEGTARDALVPLREALGEICRREIGHVAGEEHADRVTSRIVAKLMALPMTTMKDAADPREMELLAHSLVALFEGQGSGGCSRTRARIAASSMSTAAGQDSAERTAATPGPAPAPAPEAREPAGAGRP